MTTRTLRQRTISLYDREAAGLLAEHTGEWDADLIVDRVTDALLAILLDLPSDAARDELRGVVGGWCHEHERKRAAATYSDAQLFPMPDHVFVLGERVRVFARDATERHLAARVRLVTEHVRQQMAAAQVELGQLAACQEALADAAPGATLADVGALAERDEDE
jgi:hypothetical protein